MPKLNLIETWRKFRIGNPTTDEELLALHAQVDAAIDYFNDRGTEMHLAFFESALIKNQIEGYLRARGFKVTFDGSKIVIGEKEKPNAIF